MTVLTQPVSMAQVLADRGDPMAACHQAPWLERFMDIPENASPPLAMSPLHPRAAGSYGEAHFAWAKRELGITYRWWQQLAISRQLEHDADGALVYPESIETGPRRIGKSVRLRGVSCWRTDHAELIGEKQLSMLVSKDLAVGKEIHRGAWRWADKKGWKVIRLGGAQEIEKLEDESRWLLRADSAVYGYDVSYGAVDEAWGVDPQSITDGLEPALLERLWPQLHLTSTAHVRATSLMRRRLIAALRNADENVLLLMWGAHPDADLADHETWRAASPYWTPDREALIARKYAAALAGQDEPEFDDPDPIRGWAAQYLNVWPGLLDDDNAAVLPGWSDLGSRDEPPPVEALGIAADLKQASLAAYGNAYVGSVCRMDLSTGRAAFVAEVARIATEYGVPVGFDKKGAAALLAPELEELGVTVEGYGLEDRIQADGDFLDAVKARAIRHGDHADLNRDVNAATWRKVVGSDRRLFGRAPMLEAASLARHAALNAVTATCW